MADNVLHILGTAQPESTGMAYIVRALAQQLDPQQYRIHALFLGGSGPLVELLRQDGLQASSLDWGRGMRDPAGAWRFWRTLRRQRFSIVHIHFGGKSVLRLARAATHARIVRHLHGRISEEDGLTPVYFSGSGADAVVAVSQAVASRVINGPVRVIYAGLPVPPGGPPAHRPACELVIGTAGRLVELKGIEYLLNATAQLLHEFPNLRLEIAGTGPQRERLQAAAAHAGLGGHVRFLGWIDEIAPVLRGWDVFVMPSLEEGFPIAALDAMSAGLPVVATAVGGVPELIKDGACGFLIPPRDVESLVSRLRMLLASAEMRSRIGEAGYIRVRDHFSNAKMTESFAHLYDELLDKQSV